MKLFIFNIARILSCGLWRQRDQETVKAPSLPMFRNGHLQARMELSLSIHFFHPWHLREARAALFTFQRQYMSALLHCNPPYPRESLGVCFVDVHLFLHVLLSTALSHEVAALRLCAILACISPEPWCSGESRRWSSRCA